MIPNGFPPPRALLAAALLFASSTHAQEAATPAASPAPAASSAPAAKGEEKPTIKVGAFVHGDARFFLDDEGLLTDDLLIRRARADFQGKLGRFGGRLVLDFGGGKAVVQDAYADAQLPYGLRLRFGKQTPPLGLERIHSSNGNVFVENALPADLSPSRDIGLLLSRGVGKVATVAVGLFAGAADGGSVDGDVDDGKDVLARVLLRPFATAGIDLLADLQVGVAGSYGVTHGDGSAPDLGSLKSDGQATVFKYSSTSIAAGRRARLVAHGQWYAGPLVVLGEYVVSQQRVVAGAQTARVSHRAWQGTVAWALTGEKSSEAGLVPAAPLDAGGLGALQVKARAAQLDVDDDVFTGFAAGEKSVTKATAVGAGLTWWATSAVRVELDYCQTWFEGGAGTSGAILDRPTEKAILSRFQVVY